MPNLSSLVAVANRRFASSIPAALSVSAHVSRAGTLKTANLLRFMDSALWHSDRRLLQLLIGESKTSDSFCVAASLSVEPRARELANIPALADLAKNLPEKAVQPAELMASCWIEDAGGSSITFGATIESREFCVARAARKFVRTLNGKPSPWSAAEQATIAELIAEDHNAPARLLVAGALPEVKRLDVVDEGMDFAPPPRKVFATPVLPSMLGSGGHFDHAAILELAIDAHLLAGGDDEPNQPFDAAVNYLAQAQVGETLEAVHLGTSSEGKEKVLLRGAATFESWKRAPLCVVEFG